MPVVLPDGLIAARFQPISGAAQLVAAGPVLYFGAAVQNLTAAAITHTVSDGATAGGPVVEWQTVPAASVSTSGQRTVPIRLESGIWSDAGAALNINVVIYYLPLWYVATEGGILNESIFGSTED